MIDGCASINTSRLYLGPTPNISTILLTIKQKRMKSIKEKSVERAPYTKKDSWDRIKAAINAQTSFEAGANYVLDEIEKLLPKEGKNLNDYGKALVWRIKDSIEQLKK